MTATDNGGFDPATLRNALTLAVKAPSVHNTQPWKFRIGTDGIDVRADRERTLQTLDPEGRQLLISCGASLGFLQVALRAEGIDSVSDVTPDERDPDLVARVQLRAGASPSDEERALAEAIGTRRTQRTPFQARSIPAGVLRSLRQTVEREGVWLMPLHRREDQLQLVSLLARADRIEQENEAYLQELRAWVRTDATTDGIPVEVLPPSGERHSEVVIRDFDPVHSASAPGETDTAPSRPVDEHPLVVVLGTDGDQPADNVVAGVALGRLLLAAAVEGIAASPLGQVLDWPGPRAMLRQQLGVIGSPQMVLRMGYGSGETTPATARRPIEEVLVP